MREFKITADKLTQLFQANINKGQELVYLGQNDDTTDHVYVGQIRGDSVYRKRYSNCDWEFDGEDYYVVYEMTPEGPVVVSAEPAGGPQEVAPIQEIQDEMNEIFESI